ELAVELLLDVQTNLVAARRGPGEPADAAVVAHQVAVGRAAVGELRARDVDLAVLVLVGEVEPHLVLRDRSAERRVDLVVVRRAGDREACRLDGVGPVVRLERAAAALYEEGARELVAAVLGHA